MAEIKTQKTNKNVLEYLNQIEPESKKKDGLKLYKLYNDITGETAALWGDSIIGYGDTTYTTSDKKTHDWFAVGFAPRKQKLSLYVLDYSNDFDELLA